MNFEKGAIDTLKQFGFSAGSTRDSAVHWLDNERQARTLAIATLADALQVQMPRDWAELPDSEVLGKLRRVYLVNHKLQENVLQCLANMGIDVGCGACMCKAFTGCDASYEHTCKPRSGYEQGFVDGQLDSQTKGYDRGYKAGRDAAQLTFAESKEQAFNNGFEAGREDVFQSLRTLLGMSK